MFSPLNYANITYNAIVFGRLNSHVNLNYYPVFSFIFNGKLPENPVITPSSSVQVVRPSNINRYLQSVTVNAVSTPTP